MPTKNNSNPGLRNSLECLTHPVVVFSIFLLLINDHLFKRLFPGVITGKLSDFAGLLFFPFIISLVLCFFFDKHGKNQYFIGVFSIGFTALFFTAIKVIPWVNASVEQFITAISGFPSQIVLDPTDLIAIPILGFSWRLWKDTGRATNPQRSWFILGIASFATMATSVPNIEVITQLVVYDDSIYAEGSISTYVSDDKGLSWIRERDYKVPDEVIDRFSFVPQLPKIVCDPYQESECYRVSGEEIVEYSPDGGISWIVAWRVPPGRRLIMGRGNAPFDGKIIDLGPYDLVIVGTADERVTIVAMGNEGVIVGNRENNWIRQGVALHHLHLTLQN